MIETVVVWWWTRVIHYGPVAHLRRTGEHIALCGIETGGWAAMTTLPPRVRLCKRCEKKR